MSWAEISEAFHFNEVIYYISSSDLQDYLFPIKIVFAIFSAFFFAAVVYFMINSSWLQYKFMEEVSEFFAWQSYGARQIAKQWNRIRKRLDTGFESEFKLAIIEADDFLSAVLEEGGYEGETFEETVKKANRLLGPLSFEISSAHETRNSIVYNPDIPLSLEQAKRLLEVYERAINTVGIQ